MIAATIHRPQADEHAPYYARYIDLVPAGDLIAILRDQVLDTYRLLNGLPEEKANFAYAPGKWTVKDVIAHISDAERVFAYRALCFARGEQAGLPAFDENAYAVEARAGRRALADLLMEFQVVREATVQLARGLDEEMLARRGVASNHEISVRALLYITAGHERHHVSILRERYGLS